MSSIYTRATRWDVFKEVEWESHVAWVKLSEVKNSSELEQLSILQAKLVSRRQEPSMEKKNGPFFCYKMISVYKRCDGVKQTVTCRGLIRKLKLRLYVLL